jgi:hypothetical protein
VQRLARRVSAVLKPREERERCRVAGTKRNHRVKAGHPARDWQTEVVMGRSEREAEDGMASLGADQPCLLHVLFSSCVSASSATLIALPRARSLRKRLGEPMAKAGHMLLSC